MRLDRRSFLGTGLRAGAGGWLGGWALRAGLGAGAVAGSSWLLSGCGDDGAGDGDGGDSGSSASGFVLVNRFPNTALVPGKNRLAVSLAKPDGTILSEGPDVLAGKVVTQDGADVTTFTATRHGESIGLPYWPITVQIDQPGIYALDVDGAQGEPTAFQVFEQVVVASPTPGQPLPPFHTPTVDDARGVDPICTLTPDPCPFHAMTLTDALAAGKPVVYLIGTPAHCQTGTCGPGLEYLVTVAPEFAERATFVHAEVYTDDTANDVAPAVTALNLVYEPVIYVTDAAGTVVDRLDIVWDQTELGAFLSANLAA